MYQEMFICLREPGLFGTKGSEVQGTDTDDIGKLRNAAL